MMRARFGFIGLEILVLVTLIAGLLTGTIAVTQKDTFNLAKKAAVCRFGPEDCAEIAKAKPIAPPAPKPEPKAKDDVYVPPPAPPPALAPAPISQPQQHQPDQGVDNNPSPVTVQNPEPAPPPVTTTAKCWDGSYAPDGDANNCRPRPVSPEVNVPVPVVSPKPLAQIPDQGIIESENNTPTTVVQNPEPVVPAKLGTKCWNGNYAPDGDLNNCPKKPTPVPTPIPPVAPNIADDRQEAIAESRDTSYIPLPTPTPAPVSYTCNGSCFPNGEDCYRQGSGTCAAGRFCCQTATAPPTPTPTPTPVPTPTPTRTPITVIANGIECTDSSQCASGYCKGGDILITK